MAELKKKYGLITAICMVVGIVVGSGVFFKAEAMLNITNGDLPVALISWLIGGCVMVISAYTIAVMGTKFEKINGVVDYSEALVGSKYAYYVGWFMATIYYPAMTSALAWLSARYTMVLFGFELNSAETMVLAFVYLILSFALNTLSPKLAGHFQVSTTVIKLIPLILMAVVGTIYGIKNGVLIDNMNSVVELVKDAEGNIISTHRLQGKVFQRILFLPVFAHLFLLMKAGLPLLLSTPSLRTQRRIFPVLLFSEQLSLLLFICFTISEFRAASRLPSFSRTVRALRSRQFSEMLPEQF